MKLMLEFDLTMQPAELTLAQLTTKINAFIVEHEINSLQIHEVRRTKSRRLDEAFLTWGVGELSEEHIALLMEILAHQFGLIGYTAPIPEPLTLAGGSAVADGLTLAATLTPDTATVQRIVRLMEGYTGDAGGFVAGTIRNTGAGNVYSDGGLNDPALIYTQLELSINGRDSSSRTLTIPKTSAITLKDKAGNTKVLANRQNDIVLTLPASLGFDTSVILTVWLDSEGKMYVASLQDRYTLGDIAFRTFNDATAYPAL